MIVQDTVIVEKALQNLEANTGIIGRWRPLHYPGKNLGLDGTVTLSIDKKKITFNTEVKKELRQYHLDKLLEQAYRNQPFMVVAERILPLVKKRLQDEGVAYIDGAGNVCLRTSEKFLWIEGMKAPETDEQTPASRVFTKAGLKVIYVLLEQQQMVNATYREIADLAGVALGTVNVVIAGLKGNGYLLQLNKKKVLLQNKKELLERWIDGYRDILKPALHLGTYHTREITGWRSLELPADAVWGGEAAAGILTDYLNPQLLTIYTDGTKNALLKKLNLVSKADGNVKIYQKFWKAEPDGLPHDVAPYLLTYADLLMTEDPRCVETAQLIYDNHLKSLFE